MDPIRVPRFKNRVPIISENYHRVPRIRENRVPTGPYRIPNIFLKKTMGHNHNIFTLIIILNKKVGHHFCQLILLFWLQQKVVPCPKYKRNYECFCQNLSRPQEKGKQPRGVSDSRLKTTELGAIGMDKCFHSQYALA